MVDDEVLYSFFVSKIAVRFRQSEHGLKRSFRNWKENIVAKKGEAGLEQAFQVAKKEGF